MEKWQPGTLPQWYLLRVEAGPFESIIRILTISILAVGILSGRTTYSLQLLPAKIHSPTLGSLRRYLKTHVRCKGALGS